MKTKKYYKDILVEFNNHFGTDMKLATFRYRCVRDGLRDCGVTGGIVEFTKEQDEWLIANQGIPWQELTDKFNSIYGVTFSKEKIRRHMGRYLKQKSNIPRQSYVKQKPLYSKRYNQKDDCIEIKVCDEIGKCKWVAEHIFMWESANGKIPNNHKVIHLNGDRTDNRLENLYLVSDSVMIFARITYNWDNHEPMYRLCALKNSELKLMLD